MVANGAVRPGSGPHQRLDSKEIRDGGSGVLRIARVLRPSAPCACGGRPTVDSHGGESGQSAAKRDHSAGDAGGVNSLWAMAAGSVAGEHATGAVRSAPLRPVAALLASKRHGG